MPETYQPTLALLSAEDSKQVAEGGQKDTHAKIQELTEAGERLVNALHSFHAN